MSHPISSVERLSPENIHHLVFLFKEVFKKKISLNYIKRKYDTNYLGKSYYGFIAYDKPNSPIAFHGCVPYRMLYKGNVELGAQFGDAMTLKKYNGKGIFTVLGSMTEELLKKEGINFAYGLPNQNSEYGYIHKLHWKHTERMIGFKIPVLTFPYEKIYRKSGGGKFYQKRVSRLLHPYYSDRDLEHSLNENENVTVLRDETFYKYKSYTPNKVLMFDGIKVWIKAEGIFMVGDIAFTNEMEFKNTINKLKRVAFKLGLNKMVLQYHPGTQQEKILSKYYQQFISWAICYQPYNTDFPLEKLRFNYGDLDTF